MRQQGSSDLESCVVLALLRLPSFKRILEVDSGQTTT